MISPMSLITYRILSQTDIQQRGVSLLGNTFKEFSSVTLVSLAFDPDVSSLHGADLSNLDNLAR